MSQDTLVSEQTARRYCGRTVRTSYEDAQCDWEGEVLVSEWITADGWHGETWDCPGCFHFHETDVADPAHDADAIRSARIATLRRLIAGPAHPHTARTWTRELARLENA